MFFYFFVVSDCLDLINVRKNWIETLYGGYRYVEFGVLLHFEIIQWLLFIEKRNKFVACMR